MAKVYQPGDPRDFGEAMVYAHKLEMQRDRLAEELRNVLDSNEIEAADESTARAALLEIDNG